MRLGPHFLEFLIIGWLLGTVIEHLWKKYNLRLRDAIKRYLDRRKK